MIDVIIPAYNAHKTIKNTLKSIASQINNTDLNVYVVNDGSMRNYKNEVDFFSRFLSIKELRLKRNSGPGVARQYGIDNSNSKYIVFIDSDDEFVSTNALKLLYEEIETNNYDEVISSFYNQKENNELIEVYEDTTWLHGKIYRREFLEKNNIKFNNTSANEDNGFNQLIFLNNAKIGIIHNFTYIWKYNKDSITRRNNGEYFLKGLNGFVYNMTWAFEIAEERNLVSDNFIKSLYDTVFVIYYYYLEFFNHKDIDNLLKDSKKIIKMYKKYQKDDIMNKNVSFCNDFVFMSKTLESINLLSNNISFEDFLNKVLNS